MRRRANVLDFQNVVATLTHLHTRPAFLLRRSQQILAYLYAEECEEGDAEISQAQLDALHVISICPGLDQTTLARRLGIDRANATGVIHRLVKRGLVTRTVQSDRRRRSLTLAAGAREQLARALDAAKRSEARLLMPLGPVDSPRLIDVLQEVACQRNSPAPEWEPFQEGEATDPVSDAPPVDLLEALYSTPAFLMDRCAQIGNAHLLVAVTPFKLSTGQYAVLFVVGALGPIDQSGLCRAIGIDRFSASVIVAALEKHGLARRKIDLRDRRRSVIECTQEGFELLKKAHSVTEAAADRIFDGLAHDVAERLGSLLGRLVGAHGGFHAEYTKPGRS